MGPNGALQTSKDQGSLRIFSHTFKGALFLNRSCTQQKPSVIRCETSQRSQNILKLYDFNDSICDINYHAKNGDSLKNYSFPNGYQQ